MTLTDDKTYNQIILEQNSSYVQVMHKILFFFN